MPKEPSGITKSKRLEAVRQVLRRWGRLNKQQINQYVSTHLGADADEISRALYRDLEELVANGEAVDYRFSPDGKLIDNYDPDVHKNTNAEWALVGSENTVLGDSILREIGGSFYAPARLVRDFRIEAGSTEPSFQTIHIYFSVLQSFLCLKLNVNALPIKLLIGRPQDQLNYTPPLEDIYKRFGKRTAVLLIPLPNISSTISSEKCGHASIDIANPEVVSISDLNSKNGTSYYKMSQNDADLLRRKGNLLGDKTISMSWTKIKRSDLIPVKIPSGNSETMSLPVLVELSLNFRLLIA